MAEGEAEVIIFEPAQTRNTGNVVDEKFTARKIWGEEPCKDGSVLREHLINVHDENLKVGAVRFALDGPPSAIEVEQLHDFSRLQSASADTCRGEHGKVRMKNC